MIWKITLARRTHTHTHTHTAYSIQNCKLKDAKWRARYKYTKRDVYFVFYSSSSPIEHQQHRIASRNLWPEQISQSLCWKINVHNCQCSDRDAMWMGFIFGCGSDRNWTELNWTERGVRVTVVKALDKWFWNVTKCLRAGLPGTRRRRPKDCLLLVRKKSYLPAEGPAKFVLCQRNQMGL